MAKRPAPTCNIHVTLALSEPTHCGSLLLKPIYACHSKIRKRPPFSVVPLTALVRLLCYLKAVKLFANDMSSVLAKESLLKLIRLC